VSGLLIFDIGVVHIVSMVQEGLHNAPGLYGSEVRKLGKVTGFGSGLLEGGKVRITPPWKTFSNSTAFPGVRPVVL
jgi:hypothetical protein